MARSIAFVVLACALVACATFAPEPPAPPAADRATHRELPAGEVIGSVSARGAHVWRGLPFAAPPVGELRWKAPRPAPAWTGVFQALESSPPCVQPVTFLARQDTARDSGLLGDEDCLYLNVYAPPFDLGEVPAGGARRPVMVWIHGGGNVIGEGSTYDGSVLATRHGVVVVTVNYRLGPLGWMRHQALRSTGQNELDASGNFGTLDLVAALQWVRTNVSAFGGDPGNVTIFGESAGGLNTISLLLARPAAGLFHRAIAQSGGTWSSSPQEAEHWADASPPGKPWSSNQLAAALVETDGLADGATAARAHVEGGTDDQLAAYLRGKTADEIWAPLVAGGEGEANLFDDLPMMFRDGTVLPSRPFHDAFGRGEHHRVPIVLGTNRDETKAFMSGDPEYVRMWFGFIPQIRDWDVFERDARYTSDLWKADGADEIASALYRHQPGGVWVYRFDWDEAGKRLWIDVGRMVGAAHGLEIPFVFGTFDMGFLAAMFDEENESGRLQLSGAMMSYWTRFAASGDPDRGRDGDLPAWTAWDEATDSTPRTLLFDTEAGGGVRMSAETVRFDTLAAAIREDPTLSEAERCEALDDIAGLALRPLAVASCGESAGTAGR